jgi:hypothetical protein
MPKWITNATRPYSQIVKLSETTLTHAVREGLRNHNHMKLAVSHSCTKANSPSPANHQVPRSDTPKHLLQTQSDTCQGALSMHALASSLVLWLNQGRYLGTWILAIQAPTTPDTLGGVSWKPSPYRHYRLLECVFRPIRTRFLFVRRHHRHRRRHLFLLFDPPLGRSL